MSWSDEEDERAWVEDQMRKYVQAFPLFRRLDWGLIADIAQHGPLARRVEYAHGPLQTIVFRLTDRPSGKRMRPEEVDIFSRTLQACWRVWPDYHTGLHMLVDFFNEKMEAKALKALDEETCRALQAMSQQRRWPNNPLMGGPAIAAAAQQVLHQVQGGPPPRTDPLSALMGGFAGGSPWSLLAGGHIAPDEQREEARRASSNAGGTRGTGARAAAAKESSLARFARSPASTPEEEDELLRALFAKHPTGEQRWGPIAKEFGKLSAGTEERSRHWFKRQAKRLAGGDAAVPSSTPVSACAAQPGPFAAVRADGASEASLSKPQKASQASASGSEAPAPPLSDSAALGSGQVEELARVVEVGKVWDLPNSDRLSASLVDSQQVVFGRGEFRQGDLAIFVKEGAMLPEGLLEAQPQQEILRRSQFVVRKITLRGEPSHGLLLPLDVAGAAGAGKLQAGTAVTQTLGIQPAWRGGRKFRVCNVEGKGMGAVAVCAIKKGELILEEQSILRLPPQSGTLRDALVAQERFSPQREEYLKGLLGRRSQKDQDSFWELADSHVEEPGGRKTASGIVQTNGLPLGVGSPAGGIFPVASRFNHSCTPNVNHSWQEDEGVEVLRANVDIAAGQELCIGYIQLYQDREERQEKLRSSFKFDCACAACSLTGTARDRSDRNRNRLQVLDEMIPRAGMSDPREGLELVDSALQLIDQELLGSPPMKCRTYYDGFQLALASGDIRLAREMARGAYKNSVHAEGPSSRQTLKYKGYVDNPTSHPAALMASMTGGGMPGSGQLGMLASMMGSGMMGGGGLLGSGQLATLASMMGGGMMASDSDSDGWISD